MFLLIKNPLHYLCFHEKKVHAHFVNVADDEKLSFVNVKIMTPSLGNYMNKAHKLVQIAFFCHYIDRKISPESVHMCDTLYLAQIIQK